MIEWDLDTAVRLCGPIAVLYDYSVYSGRISDEQSWLLVRLRARIQAMMQESGEVCLVMDEYLTTLCGDVLFEGEGTSDIQQMTCPSCVLTLWLWQRVEVRGQTETMLGQVVSLLAAAS